MKSFKAFTLAEVLITIAVIGVVAAMTLPVLINKYQKMVTVQQLKKAYTELNQIISMSVNENGDVKTWPFIDQNSTLGDQENFVRTYILPYAKNIVDCSDRNAYYNIKACRQNINGWITSPKYILSDGKFVFIQPYGAGLWIYVDLNGSKGPNRVARDIFVFELTFNRNSVEFFGYSLFRNYTRNAMIIGGGNLGSYGCNKSNDSHAGYICGLLIQKDGWKIENDYPW